MFFFLGGVRNGSTPRRPHIHTRTASLVRWNWKRREKREVRRGGRTPPLQHARLGRGGGWAWMSGGLPVPLSPPSKKCFTTTLPAGFEPARLTTGDSLVRAWGGRGRGCGCGGPTGETGGGTQVFPTPSASSHHARPAHTHPPRPRPPAFPIQVSPLNHSSTAAGEQGGHMPPQKGRDGFNHPPPYIFSSLLTRSVFERL